MASDLISKELAYKVVKDYFKKKINASEYMVDVVDCNADLQVLLFDQPTVDAVEVVHGEWEECDWVKYDGHGECVHYPNAALRCSNCCTAFKKELLWKDNYCPGCGAKMDGGDK